MHRLRVVSSVFVFFVNAAYSLAQEPPRQPGWVVIPVTEYQALRNKAFPVEHKGEPTLEATLSKIDYDLRVEGALASGQAVLTIDVLREGWVRVPIPSGLLVRQSRVDGHAVTLTPTPGRPGELSAVLSKRGRSVLVLDVAFPVTSAGGEERLVLQSGSSGVTRAAIALAGTLPSQELDVKLTGGLISEKTTAHWLAYARGSEPLSFSWRKKIEEKRAELPLRMRGSLTQIVGLGEDSTSISAEVQVDVLQGAATQVRIAVPPSITINQVPGATVADWDVKGGELLVHFLEPVERSAQFAIRGESRLARDGAIHLPLLQLLDAERVTGAVAVDVVGAGEIKETKPQGLEPVDANELGTAIASRQSPSMVSYRLRPGGTAPSLDLTVARYTQQAVLTANIEEARYRVMASVDGKLLIQARLAVRNNQRSFLKVTLPQGAIVWSSSVAGRAVRAGQGPDGSLLFPLPKSRAGEDAPVFAVEVLYLSRETPWQPRGKVAINLPSVDLPVSRSAVSLYYPPAYRVTPASGAFRVQAFETSTAFASGAVPMTDMIASSGTIAASTQALVDGYRARSNARRAADTVPAGVAFPTIGPSLYLVSELSSENRTPVIELEYQADKKGQRK